MHRLYRWPALLALAALLPLLAGTPSYAIAPQSTASVVGTVVLAGTGAALPGARVCVVGTSVCATSAANGQYTLSGVAAGGRALRLTLSGHAQLNVPLTLTAGQRATVRSAMVPLPAAGELRIVLSWGAAPTDLDSYLWVPDGSSAYRVEPGQRGSLNGFPFAVFNWSAYERPNSPPIAGSGAVVEVYDQRGRIGRYVAPASGTGKWWTVFHYVGASRTLTGVNTLSDTRPLP